MSWDACSLEAFSRAGLREKVVSSSTLASGSSEDRVIGARSLVLVVLSLDTLKS